jgi:hypothetical protein
MKSIFIALSVLFITASCSSLKVAQVNPQTGYFPGQKKAPVVSAEPIDLDSRRDLIVVGKSDFLVGQLQNINYFGEVITVEELEKRIIAAGLTDKVPSVRDRIGLSNAANHYKPFLWLRLNTRGSQPNAYAQFILSDPRVSEDYFVTETKLDYMWTGVNDQANWYPMFNSLIDYIKQNSRSYQR